MALGTGMGRPGITGGGIRSGDCPHPHSSTGSSAYIGRWMALYERRRGPQYARRLCTVPLEHLNT